MRVLVVEDEIKMASLIRRGLRSEGLAADVAIKGEDALWMAGSTEYDAIVLDVMLPGIDGFETCRRLRQAGVWAPVLMLTARDAVDDRVAGLDGGADDYLTKPFSFAELLARLRALARRGPVERPAVLEVGDLRLDPAARRVWRGDNEVSLSAKEFQLLETFMRHPGEVLSRYQLLEHAWDYDYENRSNIVDVYVRYLRDKIDRPFGLSTLETVRGAGYRLDDRVPAVGRRSVQRRVGRHRREQRVAAALAPQHGGPQLVRVGGEDLLALRRLDDPRVLGQLVLELAGTPAGVPGEHARAAHRAVELLGVVGVGADEAEVVLDERAGQLGPVELGEHDHRGLRHRAADVRRASPPRPATRGRGPPRRPSSRRAG